MRAEVMYPWTVAYIDGDGISRSESFNTRDNAAHRADELAAYYTGQSIYVCGVVQVHEAKTVVAVREVV